MANRGSKGTAFERDICRQLSLWWTRGKRDDVYWRATTSGARATVRARKGQPTCGQYGDITAMDKVGLPLLSLMTLELKRGYNHCTPLDLLELPPLKPRNNKLREGYRKWIIQAQTAGDNAGAEGWAIIHKRDARPVMLLMERNLHQLITPVIAPAIVIRLPRRPSLVYTPLVHFLHTVTPQLVESACAYLNKTHSTRRHQRAARQR